MRRLAPLLVLLILALLAGFAWTVLSGDRTGGPPRGDAFVAGDGAGAPEGGAEDAPAAPERAASRVREHAAVPAREETAEEEATTPFTVRVVDEQERPVPGLDVIFQAPGMEKEGESRLTRSDGRATWDGPASLLPGQVSVHGPLFDHEDLRGTETVIVLKDLLPLEIEFLDQETCRPVAVWITGSPLEDDDVLSHQLLTRYVQDPGPVRRGRRTAFTLGVAAPEGYVLSDRGVFRDGVVSRYATAVRTVVPVAREVRLHVTVLRHDGTPAPDATVDASVTGARLTSVQELTDAGGSVVVTGLPFLRGERLTVGARDAEGRESPSEGVTLIDADRELRVELRLPEKPAASVIGIGGGSSSAFSGRNGKRRVPDGTGRLDVVVTRRNGLPAARAAVLLIGPVHRESRTDTDGRASFATLPGGAYTIRLREPGLVPTDESVSLVDGESLTVAVRESEGRAVSVRVVDAEGLPLPMVRVTVDLPWREPHVQLDDDGTQPLDHWTDLSGRVRFDGLPEGTVRVVAVLGSRRVNADLGGDEVVLALPNR